MKALYRIFALYCFATLAFFNPFQMLSPVGQKAIMYVLLMMLFGSLFLKYKKSPITPTNEWPLKLMLFGMFISCFMPTLCDFGQSLSSTLRITLTYFAYGLYFALTKYNVKASLLEKLVLIIAFIGVVTFIINRITFPDIIFGAPQEEFDTSRGTVRIPVIGFAFIVLAFFISLHKWTQYKMRKWEVAALIFYLTILASLTRQHILVCTVLGYWLLTSKMQMFKRLLIISAGVIAVFYFAPKIPFVERLIKISKEQHERNVLNDTEDIRILAARYYGYVNFPYTINRILGNGVPTFKSSWGKEFEADIAENRCFLVDVGIFGFYWHFGIISLLALLILVYHNIRHATRNNLFCRYYFIWLFTTSFASGTLLFPFEIVVTVIALYLFDKLSEKPIRNVRYSYPQLQQSQRYN